jgi:hypothetical protein
VAAKKIIVTGFTLYFVMTNIASAQSEFAGAFTQFGLGYGVVSQNSSQTIVASNGSTVLGSSTLGSLNSVVGSLGLGHYWDVHPSWVLGIGADFSPGASSWASFTVNSTTGQPPAQGRTRFSNAMNFYWSPGYLLDADKLIYAKMGYARSTATASSDLLTKSGTLEGFSLGLGYKQTFNDNFYGFVEWKYVRFNPVTDSTTIPYAGTNLIVNATGQPFGNDIILGLGYRF